jgi:hypothetical protein
MYKDVRIRGGYPLVALAYGEGARHESRQLTMAYFQSEARLRFPCGSRLLCGRASARTAICALAVLAAVMCRAPDAAAAPIVPDWTAGAAWTPGTGCLECRESLILFSLVACSKTNCLCDTADLFSSKPAPSHPRSPAAGDFAGPGSQSRIMASVLLSSADAGSGGSSSASTEPVSSGAWESGITANGDPCAEITLPDDPAWMFGVMRDLHREWTLCAALKDYPCGGTASQVAAWNAPVSPVGAVFFLMLYIALLGLAELAVPE